MAADLPASRVNQTSKKRLLYAFRTSMHMIGSGDISFAALLRGLVARECIVLVLAGLALPAGPCAVMQPCQQQNPILVDLRK
jgi:hypothetical protein